MSGEQSFLLGVLCLLAGYGFGCFPCADVAAHCVAGTSIRYVGSGSPEVENVRRYLGKGAALWVVAGDILKTVLACWFCYKLAAPELEYTAMVYGGFGVLLGHSWPPARRPRNARGAIVTGAWIAVCLPVSGVLCALAGIVMAAGTGKKVMGTVGIPLLAVPVAWLQYGITSAAIVLAAALVVVWQYREEWRAFSPKNAKKRSRHKPFER